MTTVFDQAADRAQTHALVIGVGEYPVLASLANAPDRVTAALARRWVPVSSPPASAVAVARWLLAAAGDDHAPVGSIELLASGLPTGLTIAGVRPAAPTWDAIQAAFGRWYARCDTRTDNVAFLFFAGHGCAKAGQLLLPDDIGANGPLDRAIAFESTVDAMASCRAGIQCFFVDACRDTPDELYELLEPLGQPLRQPTVHRPRRDAPIVYSTGAGQAALDDGDGGPSPFTRTLLRALDGLAAERTQQGWEVTTSMVGPRVQQLFDFTGLSARGQRPASAGETDGGVIRRLRGRPTVPFRLGCDPRAALKVADLTLTEAFTGRVALHREPRAALWEDTIAAGFDYAFAAHFQAGGYRPAQRGVPIAPPCQVYDLPV